MTQDQFHTWMLDPTQLNAESVSQLREVVAKYPYFQVAQMMLAKNLKQLNHIDQLRQLQTAAVIVPDRKRLHNYLHDRISARLQVVNEETAAEIEEAAKPAASFPDELLETVVYDLETATLPDVEKTESETPLTHEEPSELSFIEWLEYVRSGASTAPSEQPTSPMAARVEPSRNNIELIDYFLTQQSENPNKRAEFFNPQKVAAKSTEEDFTVISETLANIYYDQERYDLAAQAFTALSLKYPEKSVYFAARLKEIAEKQNA